jgi:hypothetical protein
MEHPQNKFTWSYRLAPNTIQLIEEAAKVTSASQGDIFEKCVLLAIDSVTKELREENARNDEMHRQKLAELQKLPKRSVGRPRKNP